MQLVYVHGHGASKDSFNFINSEIESVSAIFLEYDSKNGFDPNLALMFEQLKNKSRIFFIAHSQGGNYALHLADLLGDRVIGAVTMATPYGGSEAALALNFLSPQQLYKDIHPTANPITRGRKIDLCGSCSKTFRPFGCKPKEECGTHREWTAIVTTKGHSHLMSGANDGIVTMDSMRNRLGARFIEVASNHHEVVQSRCSTDIIKASIRKIKDLENRA